MSREHKILKAVLLLRRAVRRETKEEQIRFVDKHYSDEELDRWILLLKQPEEEHSSEYDEEDCQLSADNDTEYIRSCTSGDYSPSNSWYAPGMSIKDFI